ncbi:MAG: type III pantothenate kinase [Betaproteobacteria bacterium]|nr:type III pantothenate kinase [Betaproteobacteria bacterium]
MWLAVDCGNTRIKWAAVKNGAALTVQTAPAARPGALQKAARRASEAWVSHAGGVVARRDLRAVLRGCGAVNFVRSAARGGGVINSYRPPESLGVDRWLALVAARPMQKDLIIITAGTAATIDALRADGVFLGGAILPGIGLMHGALARRTNLSAPEWGGGGLLPPCTTAAAMCAGAVFAAAGAARMFRKHCLSGARFLVSGGDAEKILPWLPKSAAHIPHLPIRGLIRLRGMRP